MAYTDKEIADKKQNIIMFTNYIYTLKENYTKYVSGHKLHILEK